MSSEVEAFYYLGSCSEPVLRTFAKGRAIAQALGTWLPTAADRVRARVRSCGICGGKSSTGVGFL
jgi:hypothetical protein